MSDTPRIVPMALIDALREIARTSSDPGARAIANATLVAAGLERVTPQRDVRSTPNEMRRQVMFDPIAYADAYYADFAQMLEHMSEQPKTWTDEQLTAVLLEAARQIGDPVVDGFQIP